MDRRALAVPDRHALYETCVQAPARLVPLLVAIHGGAPRVLGEDFCGTAAVSRAWLALVPESRARALDVDAAVLARAAASADANVRKRLELVRADVRGFADAARADLDVLFTGNFSVGELATRAELLAYLILARKRLAPGGVFVCDLYGGESAFRTGAIDSAADLKTKVEVRNTGGFTAPSESCGSNP